MIQVSHGFRQRGEKLITSTIGTTNDDCLETVSAIQMKRLAGKGNSKLEASRMYTPRRSVEHTRNEHTLDASYRMTLHAKLISPYHGRTSTRFKEGKRIDERSSHTKQLSYGFHLGQT